MAFAPRVPVLILLSAVLLLPWQASAQTYPSRTARIIVPFGPGGPADTAARVLAQHLSEALKQSFVVENRPGAGSIIGTGEAAKSAPDGYTLLVMSDTHTTNESLMPNKPYQLMRDFVAVAPINYTDLMLVVTPSLAAKDLREFIALAKQNSGKFSYASSGQGTAYHMAAELFKAKSGTDIVHVPHRAAGEMRSSVMGGHVQIMFDAISISAPNVLGGKLTALGVTGRARSPILPDVPTMGEAGLSGFETAGIWCGVMAPAGTPKEIVNLLNIEINKIIAKPEVREGWAKQGAVPMVMTASEFDAMLLKDIQERTELVRTSGLKPQ
jgi:tripartite-type tricarboxylate transporter receptor subunit TctC